MVARKGYKLTEVGEVPEDWKLTSYGELFEFMRTASYSRADTNDQSDTQYIHYGDIHVKLHGLVTLDHVDLPRVADAKVKNYTLLQDGDVIMADASEDYDGVGKSIEISTSNDVRAISGLHTYLLRDIGGKLVNGFKAYIHAIDVVKEQLQTKATGLKVYGISKTQLSTIQIPLPPTRTEQCAIATALGDADAWVRSLEALIEKKQRVKEGVMTELLRPRAGWTTLPLGNVCHIKTGTRNNQDKVENGRYPFFVRSQKIERIDDYSYDEEAILIPGEGNIGDIFHYINGKFEVHQRVYKISDFSPVVLGRYVFYQMMQNFGDIALQNSVKATVDSLRLPTFQEFPMPVPPELGDQGEIVHILDSLRSELQTLQTKLTKARALKAAIMRELLTGRIRLVGAEAQVAV